MIFFKRKLKKVKELFQTVKNPRFAFREKELIEVALMQHPRETLTLILEQVKVHDKAIEHPYQLLVRETEVLDCFLNYADGEMLKEYLILYWEAIRLNLKVDDIHMNYLNNLLPAVGYRVSQHRKKLKAPLDVIKRIKYFVDHWEQLPAGHHPKFTGGSESNDDKKHNVQRVYNQLIGIETADG